jgi:LCP family protein required for cell wall assembly
MSEFQNGGVTTPQETDTINNTQQNPTPDMNPKNTQIVDVVPTYSSSLPHQNEPTMPEEAKTPPQKRKSRLTFGKLLSVVVFFIAVILIGVFIFGYSMISNTGSLMGGSSDEGGIFSQIGQIGNILNITKRDPIKGEKEGRTNILLLGKDEGGGAGLTDTIMIASYYHREKKIVTLSIPRDFWVYGETKINGLYTIGEQQEEGSGEQKLIKFLTEEYDIPIHYFATINFNGVKDIVDALGGIDVDVPVAFTDYDYPNDGYAWINGSSYMVPAPSFTTGIQKMDGKKALIYARSRHAGGGEGSDFSRNKRQSIIIQAVLEKLKSQNFFDNVTKINTYLGIINKNLKTNMRLDEMTSFAQILKEVDLKNNFLRANWDSENGFLCYSPNPAIYKIDYCDGTTAGTKSTGKSKALAKDYVLNLLNKVESNANINASVSIYGNGSFDADTMYNTFAGWGFTNVNENNTYTSILPATATSKEKVEIFIKDEKIRTQFQALQNTSKLTYTVGTEIPATYKIPAGQAKSDIIVWVSPK